MKKAKFWIIPIVLAAVLLFAAKSYMYPAAKSTQKQQPVNATSIGTATAEYMKKTPKLTLTGSLEGQTSASISAKISGRIEEVLVEDGQKVDAGQPLIRLESTELINSQRIASDSVRKAQANYDNAKADYERYLTLYDKNAISRQQLDSMETKLQVAAADLSSAAATLSSAQQQLNNSVLLAPVGGVVANKTATVGQVVSPASPLMTVEKIGELYAVVNIEQKNLGQIAVGQNAEIAVDTYPDTVFTGTVDTINPVAGSASRMFRTKIKLANDDGLLKPGMFIKVSVSTGKETDVLTVPQSAVFQKQGLYYVYVIENNKAVRRQVEIGETIAAAVEIRSGLKEQEAVAVSNVIRLKDGDTVEVSN